MNLIDELINNKINVVIFDLDDTLYPEKQYVVSGLKFVSDKINRDYGCDCYDLMLRLFEEDNKNVFNRTLDRLNLIYDQPYINGLIAEYRDHTPINLKFYSDVLPFINELKNKKIRVGIITDGRVKGQRNKVIVLKCDDIFEKIIITDELGGIQYRKPSYKSFELMSEYYNVPFNQIAYIGDNPEKDFFVGKLGVFTVRVKRKDALKIYSENYYMGIKENLTVTELITGVSDGK